MALLRKRHKNPQSSECDIPTKSHRVLSVILFIILLIIIRLWFLTTIDHQRRNDEFTKPKHKTLIIPALRGTIRDRFNQPLAVNQIRYNAAISYAQIRHIPTISWVRNPSTNKKQKIYKRREYIHTLSSLLSDLLQMDEERIEDLIHSKASLFNDAPFVLKEDLSEEQYYRLKTLEKDYAGIIAQVASKRYYPHGHLAGEVIGYMGAINRKEYNFFYEEKQFLEDYLNTYRMGTKSNEYTISPNEAYHQYKDLEEKAYTLHDKVGKAGIEGAFDRALRGYRGKTSYYSDAKGTFLREMPGSKETIPGQRLLLTISRELQECAETLLIENESLRDGRSIQYDPSSGTFTKNKQPWIKGGAIVVMDPNNGEILTLATYPRFDPNAFIPSGNKEENEQKQMQILKYFETEAFIAKLWDQKYPLERERLNPISRVPFTEQQILTWDTFLDFILPDDSMVKQATKLVENIKNAITIQTTFERLIEISEQNNPWYILKILYSTSEHKAYPDAFIPKNSRSLIEQNFKCNQLEVNYLKRIIDPFLSSMTEDYEKLLLIDLCRLSVKADLFSEELLNTVKHQTLSEYKQTSAAYAVISSVVENMTKQLFHDLHFKQWREKYQKQFLKEKRAEEKAKKLYAKPYIDYLDAQEVLLFETFWQQHKWSLMLQFLGQNVSLEEGALSPYLEHLHLWYHELSHGAHQNAAWYQPYKLLSINLHQLPQHLVKNYLTTLRAFNDLNRPLLGRYKNVSFQKPQLEKHLAASFYPSSGFGYARSHAFRQATTQGSLFKLITAYESLMKKYHSFKEELLDFTLLNPLTIVDDLHPSNDEKGSWNIGYTEYGKPIPQYYKGGRLPRSHRRHIGKLNLTSALAVSSNCYFSLLAMDVLNDPNDLIHTAEKFSLGKRTGIALPGEYAGNLPDDLADNPTGLYASAIGQHSISVTPLQTAVMLSTIANKGTVFKPKIIQLAQGRQPIRNNDLIFQHDEFDYKDLLECIGIDFPFFSATERNSQKIHSYYPCTEITNTIDFPKPVTQFLMQGMKKVVLADEGTANWKKVRYYARHSSPLKNYIALKNQIVGKTSTAEQREPIDLDLKKGTNLYKHIWFGGISFDPDHEDNDIEKGILEHPELVVIVYLRYGDYGREAAPIAAELIQKWRDIKAAYEYKS